MSVTIQAERDESALPLTLAVTRASDGGVAGLTCVLQIRDASTPDSYLDFADSTFKTSGWTTKQASLLDLGDGLYVLSGGLDIGSITNLPAATNYLSAEYIVSGAVSGTTIDTILLRTSVYDQNKDLLQRNLADAESLPTERSLGGAIQKLTNRVRVDGTKLEVYETDDTTVSYEQSLTTNPNAEPIVEANTD